MYAIKLPCFLYNILIKIKSFIRQIKDLQSKNVTGRMISKEAALESETRLKPFKERNAQSKSH